MFVLCYSLSGFVLPYSRPGSRVQQLSNTRGYLHRACPATGMGAALAVSRCQRDAASSS